MTKKSVSKLEEAIGFYDRFLMENEDDRDYLIHLIDRLAKNFITKISNRDVKTLMFDMNYDLFDLKITESDALAYFDHDCLDIYHGNSFTFNDVVIFVDKFGTIVSFEGDTKDDDSYKGQSIFDYLNQFDGADKIKLQAQYMILHNLFVSKFYQAIGEKIAFYTNKKYLELFRMVHHSCISYEDHLIKKQLNPVSVAEGYPRIRSRK